MARARLKYLHTHHTSSSVTTEVKHSLSENIVGSQACIVDVTSTAAMAANLDTSLHIWWAIARTGCSWRFFGVCFCRKAG
jgi:hypothetical protein